MRVLYYGLALLLLAPLSAHANTPSSLEELLETSVKHYPKIAQAKAKREAVANISELWMTLDLKFYQFIS